MTSGMFRGWNRDLATELIVLEAEMCVPPDPSLDAEGVQGILGAATVDFDRMSEAMDITVTQATTAVDGLHDLLRRLEALAALAREHQRNEVKIGELFIKVQEYIDRATTEAEEQARNLIAEAEFEAGQIVAAAKEEAHRLISDARRPAGVPSGALAQLQVTIDGFARLNSELLRELTVLNQTLKVRERAASASPAIGAPLPPPPRRAPFAGRPQPPRNDPALGRDGHILAPVFYRAG
jgi:hypothetical protein